MGFSIGATEDRSEDRSEDADVDDGGADADLARASSLSQAETADGIILRGEEEREYSV